MNLTVKGKHLDVGDALRTYVRDQLTAITEKYFSNPIDATVVFVQEAHLYCADIAVRVGRGILLQASAETTDIYPAFDTALDKLEKRLRRYKRRLRDHHAQEMPSQPEAPARQYVLEADLDADEEAGREPVIIAEMDATIETLSVADAVMRMDLADLPALLFRSGVHGGLNMIYRRPDGHVGWIDPKGSSSP
jgi:ribosomal subunit interface protein